MNTLAAPRTSSRAADPSTAINPSRALRRTRSNAPSRAVVRSARSASNARLDAVVNGKVADASTSAFFIGIIVFIGDGRQTTDDDDDEESGDASPSAVARLGHTARVVLWRANRCARARPRPHESGGFNRHFYVYPHMDVLYIKYDITCNTNLKFLRCGIKTSNRHSFSLLFGVKGRREALQGRPAVGLVHPFHALTYSCALLILCAPLFYCFALPSLSNGRESVAARPHT